jgi:hypothetical protein
VEVVQSKGIAGLVLSGLFVLPHLSDPIQESDAGKEYKNPVHRILYPPVVHSSNRLKRGEQYIGEKGSNRSENIVCNHIFGYIYRQK